MDGFKIKIKKFQLTFTEPRGQIESPELRFRYTNNLNLTYRIETEPNSITFLRFERLSIESFNNTCIDFLEIGSTELAEVPRTICGEDIVEKFVIYSNKIYLKFVTDKSETKSGFSIFYNTIKNVFTEPSGVIKSSDYLVNLTYTITAPEDKIIEVMVDTFEFKKCSLNNTEVVIDPARPPCSQNNDYLLFQNEQGSFDQSLFQKINSNLKNNWIFCGCFRPAKLYLSISNEISIRHVLMERDQNREEPMSHFRLSYQFLPATHSQTKNLRLVQDTVNTGFIGGHLLNIQVPENHHLRLYVALFEKLKKNKIKITDYGKHACEDVLLLAKFLFKKIFEFCHQIAYLKSDLHKIHFKVFPKSSLTRIALKLALTKKSIKSNDFFTDVQFQLIL
ncbi:Cubilin [Brachionus plicatilis]|uniref:Cubilin n=1 Tax=Brachionus plicatilis TaxID=10195 RepID=A0A3M7RYT5_BRAPC|nr:Cubilin [Brachionus plicatilis]